MARSQLVDDELWELVKPLLPDRLPRRTGRPRVSDRAAFSRRSCSCLGPGYHGGWYLGRSVAPG